jgi:hypothetical protein
MTDGSRITSTTTAAETSMFGVRDRLRRTLVVVVVSSLLVVFLPTFDTPAWPAAPTTVEQEVDDFALLSPADADGRMVSQPLETDIAFTMVGFEVPAGAQVEVRARDAEGTWSSWFEAELLEGDDGPDDGVAESAASDRWVHTEPVWFGEAHSLQLRTTGADPRAIQATVIDSEGVSRSLGQRVRDALRPQPPAVEASTVPAEIIPRSGWGADESWMTWPPRATSSLQLAVVHHTAGGNTYTPEQGPAVVRGIYHYHARTLGWGDIGYNLVIDRYGKVYEGRAGGLDRAIIGGHARGFNARSFGISIMGNFESQLPPPAAEQAMARMLAWKLSLHGVDASATVQYTSAGNDRFPAGTVLRLPTIAGHRDTGWTACPGTAFYNRLRSLRDGVIAAQVPPPISGFEPLNPARVLDTRDGTGGVSGKVGHRQSVSTRIAGRGGVPADAQAVAINITAVRPSRATYLTVSPSGQPRPVVSSINVAAGATVNNFIVAQLGSNGQVNVYNHNGQVDVVFDVVGYVPRGSVYQSLRPTRVLDTRNATGDIAARIGHRRTVSTMVAGRGGVPAGARVVALNVTAVTPTRPTFLTLFPSATQRPFVSSLNVGAGGIVSNFVYAQLGPDGRLDIYNHDGMVDVVLDVVGYLPAGTDFTTVTPSRVLDTRNRTQGDHAGPLQQGQTVSQVIAGRNGVPADATAVAVNITAVNPSHTSFLTVFPAGERRPGTSALNFGPRSVVGNFLVLKLGSRGAVELYNHQGSAGVVIDVVGYYR